MSAFVTIGFLAMNINGHIPIKTILTGLKGPCSIGTNIILNSTSIVVANTLSAKSILIFNILIILSISSHVIDHAEYDQITPPTDYFHGMTPPTLIVIVTFEIKS